MQLMDCEALRHCKNMMKPTQFITHPGVKCGEAAGGLVLGGRPAHCVAGTATEKQLVMKDNRQNELHIPALNEMAQH